MAKHTEFEGSSVTDLVPFKEGEKEKSRPGKRSSLKDKAEELLGGAKKQFQDMGKDVDQKTLELHFEQFNKDKEKFWDEVKGMKATAQGLLDTASRISENLSRTQSAVVERQAEDTAKLYNMVEKLVQVQQEQTVFRTAKDVSLIALAGGCLVVGGLILRNMGRQERKSDLIIQQQTEIYRQALESQRSSPPTMTRFPGRSEQSSAPSLH